ncbi:MAG: glutamate synthase subunit beta [Alphaproteobacteria bacterium]
MGKVTGFLEYDRQEQKYQLASDRVRHFGEFVLPVPERDVERQAARCMDCGIPFCHTGCPVNNQIPDWNDLIYRGDWEQALHNLHSTNNFPEFTGRICPAPCEAACTLNLSEAPVTIKSIECAIVDRGWREGWVKPLPPAVKTGKKIAIVGAGPAGMACAQQLARAGHDVHLFDRQAKPGGLMRYGIPDFKMEKRLIDARMEQMQAEGVVFHGNVHIGIDMPAKTLVDDHDAVVLTGGSEMPRDLAVEGRDLAGVHYAMDFLPQQNRRVSGEAFDAEPILATGKHVVVIGGGDTGSDCIGTSLRQGALSVTQIEIMPKPPVAEDKLNVWPNWPIKMRTSSSQAEGAVRDWSVATLRFVGEGGQVTGLECTRVDEKFKPLAGSEFTIQAELALLAMGFVHPVHAGALEELALARDERGNVKADTISYQTSLAGVFSAGDMRRGQSLVVWAIREGREVADRVDRFLTG